MANCSVAPSRNIISGFIFASPFAEIAGVMLTTLGMYYLFDARGQPVPYWVGAISMTFFGASWIAAPYTWAKRVFARS